MRWPNFFTSSLEALSAASLPGSTSARPPSAAFFMKCSSAVAAVLLLLELAVGFGVAGLSTLGFADCELLSCATADNAISKPDRKIARLKRCNSFTDFLLFLPWVLRIGRWVAI